MRYPGSKLKHVKVLLDFVPESVEHFVEPFAGTAAMSLAVARRQPLKSLWLNDFDYGMAALWASIYRKPHELSALVEDYIPSAEDFYDFKQSPSSGDLLRDGFRKLVLHQISYSGLGAKAGSPIGGRNQTGAYKVDCRYNPSRLTKWIFANHNTLSAIDEVRITNLSWVDMESTDGFWYLDPPYYREGTGLYLHGGLDHVGLAERLRTAEHDWLLSYDDVPEVWDLYSFADVQSFPVTSHLHHKPISDVIIRPRSKE